MSLQYDVAVVGFGPVGATCAALLGKLGIRTLAIDRARDVYDKPRAFALDHEIMRVFQKLGVAEQILPHTAPFAPSEYYGVRGQLIKRLGSVPPPYPLGWTPNLVFTQPPAEAALRVCAAAQASVEVALGTELVALEQTADEVTLTLREDTGAARMVGAQYVIGCDGASSTVRALTGLHYDDLGFDEPWLVVDVHVNDTRAGTLPQVCIQYCDPARPATYLIGPGNHRRWEIMLLPGENLADMARDDNVWRLLARWITPRDATLWRAATYRFHALVARDWRQGRVFIAGDAAHQQPPFTGQGMCQGIRDVANLAWKIALALQGKAADGLLDTYAAERAAHVHAYTTLIKDIGHLICERDPAAAQARDQRLLAEAGGTIQTMPRQQLLPPLSAGLIAPDAHPANGTIFPQPCVFDGNTTTLLDALSGSWFRVVASRRFSFADMHRHDLAARLGASLVCVGATPDGGAAPNTNSAAGILHVTECDGVLARWFEQHQCAAAIVRPDHYVYGVASTAQGLDQQLEAFAARVFKETP